ncbi:src substrate protein p85-like isoform X2 [Lepisosteus oculatus]|uniref:src substrate protein p85-like isoform X2 n=1 Tax=Lepisosteus oculatus TaxID=7918 RepID=UPI00371FF986
MWKSVVGHNVQVKVSAEGDDWETDPDFENDVSEQEQRWGAKTIEGSGRAEHISVTELRDRVSQEHELVKRKEQEQGPRAAYGYGGKFGVEKDRMDKVAVGHSYVAEVEKHSSQTDAARGFGGKYGVQKERIDKSAVGFEYKADVEQHASQRDYSRGFGGKYGVEKEKVDKAALGYDYKGETEKHQSQKDYAKGFGGRYGVETDRVDKSASSFTDMESPASSYQKTKPVEASSVGAGSLKARFENMSKASDEENRRRAEEERARRQAREKREQEEARRKQQEMEQRNREKGTPDQDAPPTSGPRTPQVSRNLPEIPREDPEPNVGEQEEQEPPVPEEEGYEPEYEEPPQLPPRSEEPPQLPPNTEEPPQLPPRSDEPPQLPPRSDEPPQLPPRSDDGLEQEGEGEYEDVGGFQTASGMVPDAQENDYEAIPAGVSAVAIYDYQGEGDDEISFEPDDIITGIEMVDEAWWRGTCRGRYGLFPASYVQLMQ